MLRVDAHVHLHPAHDPLRFVHAAWRNLGEPVAPADPGRHDGGTVARGIPHACLCLSDPTGGNGFDRLRRAVESGSVPDFDLLPFRDTRGFIIRSRDRGAVLVIGGRQLVTSERIEVLAVGSRQVRERLPLARTVRAVAAEGGVSVLPWGFGKWWGTRGSAVEALLEDPPADAPLFVGDSALRPATFARPPVLTLAARNGIPDLPGSDPLPLPGHEARVGSFGFVIENSLDPEEPVESLMAAFGAITEQPPTFGTRPGIMTLVANQIALRARKGNRMDSVSEPRYRVGR